MRVLQINSTYKNGGSTGRIAFDLKQTMESRGIESFVAYGIDTCPVPENNTILLQSKSDLKISQLQSRLFARHGFYNVRATRRLLNYINEVKPDVIHLHNLHGYYIHCGMLFEYLKKHSIPVVWTLHDCWAFTGWCAYFDYSGCDRWKTLCKHCPNKDDYPKAWFTSRARSNYKLKKCTFTGVENLTLVTPSRWLADLTRESYLREYPVEVINNGVDISVFKPSTNHVKAVLGIEGKKLLLAVAGGLEKRKGREYLLKIPELLSDDEVLVILGIRKDQIDLLPKSKCIGIPYTNSVEDLALIYSAADVFINTTLEDNFPTTNIEALACGTPVITFNTGGSVEPVLDQESVEDNNDIKKTSVGGVVPKGDCNYLLTLAREYMRKNRADLSNVCVNKADSFYNKEKQYQQYISLYKNIYSSTKYNGI